MTEPTQIIAPSPEELAAFDAGCQQAGRHKTCGSCSACSTPIHDPAERWPAATTGTVCQMCWEAQSSRLWWAMVQLLPEEESHA